ncbi:protein-tyrosine sulfotransferase [Ranunculus cassubicifolius]
MDGSCVIRFIIILVLLVYRGVEVKSDLIKCQSVVAKWASSSSSLNHKPNNKHTLQQLLFFLHIPRTAGRTYFHCLLRKLYATYQECPRSYDKLHFDPSNPTCRLMVTHDDYSIMSRLPKDRTSVVTILRKPLERVLSTYEFSIEVAARFLVHPNLTSATQMMGRIRPKTNGVSTLDIWPWKYLVPWMREDLFYRRDGRTYGEFKDSKESIEPYNVERIVMPLHEFINDPIAHEIIHNGATFQVAGLTNNSCSEEAHEVRHCVMKYQSLGESVLEVAKKRLDAMLYVGLTENHKGSATMFANIVGGQVLSQLQKVQFGAKKSANNVTGTRTGSIEPRDDDNRTKAGEALKIPAIGNVRTKNETMTVEQLLEAYEVCISSLRKAQSRRRTTSLKRIAPANFSKEARAEIREEVVQEIIRLNRLDVELYKHAQHIYARQQQQQQNSSSLLTIGNSDGGISTMMTLFSSFGGILILLLFLFLVKLVRRTSSKLKL